jgi:hypothetical protein
MSFRLSTRTCLVAGLVCLQAADLICTYLLLDGGAGGGRADVYEANPVARSILATGGWLGVAAFKLAITAVAVAAALAVARRRPLAGVRLLAALCLLMLGVNAYSASLLASPDRLSAEERRVEQHGRSLDRQQALTQQFVAARTRLCDAMLDGECDTAEAVVRMTKMIAEDGPALRLPAVARLPQSSNSGDVLAYLNFHLRDRARVRGMGDRLASLGASEQQQHHQVSASSDPCTPPWISP